MDQQLLMSFFHVRRAQLVRDDAGSQRASDELTPQFNCSTQYRGPAAIKSRSTRTSCRRRPPGPITDRPEEIADAHQACGGVITIKRLSESE